MLLGLNAQRMTTPAGAVPRILLRCILIRIGWSRNLQAPNRLLGNAPPRMHQMFRRHHTIRSPPAIDSALVLEKEIFAFQITIGSGLKSPIKGAEPTKALAAHFEDGSL
ncbi:hypothetical protein J3R82DRAFT_6859 [Butyriboletus roseoflavus]|nr:hypothetical protein J3R82DRAFT_6859 [Butyriboletus roseoflavus]